MKVAVVFGTRPEIIKLAPVVLALRKKPRRFQTCLLSTAQHRGLSDQMLGLFGLEPDIDLDLMKPGQSLEELTAGITVGVNAALRDIRPGLVIVQGDTTTAMISALAAFHLRIPVAHVEAGLRTGDSGNPFPEEINRRIISVLARWHFAPTQEAARNLKREGVTSSAVFVTGNTVVDALRHIDGIIGGSPALFHAVGGQRMILVTAHRRESFGKPLENICRALIEILSRSPHVDIVFPVHPNPNVRDVVLELLSGIRRLHLFKPLDYAEFLLLMKRAHIILTDSGGIQEEAPSFRKPVLVLRETTERPEGVKAGIARLVGTDRRRIVGETMKILNDPKEYGKMTRPANPYGDGQAALRIRDILESLSPLISKQRRRFS